MVSDPPSPGTVLVVGQVAHELVLRVDALPVAGAGVAVRERRERLGGPAARQALGLRRAGVGHVRVLGVVGDDPVGTALLEQADADGLDVSAVVRRGTTALRLDLVEADGTRRLLDHVPPEALLTTDDVEAARDAFAGADTVVLHLQQPPAAVDAAASAAQVNGALLVGDGAVDPGSRDRLLEVVDVVHADAGQAQSWSGVEVRDWDDATHAARAVLAAGPSVVALGVPGRGGLVAWAGGEERLPSGEGPVDDDTFVGAFVAALRDGAAPAEAGRTARRAAASGGGPFGG